MKRNIWTFAAVLAICGILAARILSRAELMRHDGIQLLLIGCAIGCIIQILSTAEKKGDGKAERPPPRKAIVITAIVAVAAITLWVIVK